MVREQDQSPWKTLWLQQCLNLIVLLMHAAYAQPIRALTLNGSLSSVTKNFIPVNGLKREGCQINHKEMRHDRNYSDLSCDL